MGTQTQMIQISAPFEATSSHRKAARNEAAEH